MPESRPSIPAELKRAVLIEAGHRCAIPTCRQTTLNVHHIVPWEKVKEHTFENLIALCANCHQRVHNNEIDRKSLRIYKSNLSILNHRYCDFERRLLIWFHKHPEEDTVTVGSGFDILVLNVLADGLIIDITDKCDRGGKGGLPHINIVLNGSPVQMQYKITEKGRHFTEKWMNAQSIE